jgi:hypothetical protein
VYNDFFKLNAALDRKDVFKDGYHTYLDSNKNNKELTLKEVLECLEKLPPYNVERSFGSKLLSMINPVDRPPWDSVVEHNLEILGILDALEIKVPSDTLDKDKEINTTKKICAWDTFYTEICELYKGFVVVKTVSRKQWMNQFDQIFDEWYAEYFLDETKNAKCLKWLREKHFSKQDMRRSITDVKVIDLVLWCRTK